MEVKNKTKKEPWRIKHIGEIHDKLEQNVPVSPHSTRQTRKDSSGKGKSPSYQNGIREVVTTSSGSQKEEACLSGGKWTAIICINLYPEI